MLEAETENAFPMKKTWAADEVIEKLPYQLTGAQMRVWREIERDLAGEKLMSRLLQGDVGSGKTIIAFLAMVMAADNGYQSALMAPTLREALSPEGELRHRLHPACPSDRVSEGGGEAGGT